MSDQDWEGDPFDGLTPHPDGVSPPVRVDAHGCEACGGAGAVYAHAPSCVSDFCVGNGDEHSCRGAWVPCEIEASEKIVARAHNAEP